MSKKKGCTVCRKTLPLASFYMQAGYPSGMCRDCMRDYQRVKQRELRARRGAVSRTHLWL